FEELGNLHNLVIQNNLLVEVEYNLLNNAAETLETIELDKSIENIQVLYNITRGKKLLKVQLLSLQGNNIPILSNEILKAFPNVVSLYMDSSKIQSIHENTFKSCRQIKQIFIDNNRLTTLTESTFNFLLYFSPQFKISMIGNPWNCECDLKWIQDMLLKDPQMMTKIPICKTPIKNSGESFLTAEFCDYQLSTTLDASTKLQSTSEIPISYSTESSIGILCQNSLSLLRNAQRKLFSISDYEFPSKQSIFFIQQLKNGSIIVNLSKNDSQAILWFKTFNNDIGEINCLKNISGTIILNNLQDDSLYTICLLDKSNFKVSPFNCLAFKTLPAKNARIWLSNGDKTFVLSIYTVIAFLFCLLGGGSCFYIIKKHPTLLKGSKRVILVKRGQVNALVLPKGIDDDFFKRAKKEKPGKLDDFKIPRVDYLTPVMKRNRWSNVYDSIDNKRSKNVELNSRESVTENIPPPLPPHPFHGVIPSVSLLMDLEHKIPGGSNEIQDDTEIYSCIQPK
ncbi:leucine-rich repeat transmembrane protein FLRT2-like, partial [Chelonus insularis]|uniref:leucine-rich repeat transmembrane protein FLRT2-like n=1 Tax=Chelonus insularis TaxID=460826 RepID=UPI00158E60BA